MAISQINVSSLFGENIYTDTNIGSTVDAIKGSSALLLYVTVDNSANVSATYVRLWNTAGGSVINGTTAPDQVLYIAANKIQTFVMYTGSAPGVTFGTALSAAASSTGGTSGSAAPSSPVTFTAAYV